jgi:hypothetical protein
LSLANPFAGLKVRGSWRLGQAGATITEYNPILLFKVRQNRIALRALSIAKNSHLAHFEESRLIVLSVGPASQCHRLRYRDRAA